MFSLLNILPLLDKLLHFKYTLRCRLDNILPHNGFFHKPTWFSICRSKWHKNPLTLVSSRSFQLEPPKWPPSKYLRVFGQEEVQILHITISVTTRKTWILFHRKTLHIWGNLYIKTSSLHNKYFLTKNTLHSKHSLTKNTWWY